MGHPYAFPTSFSRSNFQIERYSLLQVGIVNFNPFYQAPDPENPVSSKSYGEPDIVYVQCQEDILSSELSVSNEFAPGLWAFWDPDPEEHKADFIVVGPIDNELHLTTGKYWVHASPFLQDVSHI